MFFGLMKTCHRENNTMKNHFIIVLSITLIFIFSAPLLYAKDLDVTAMTEYDAYLGLHHAGLTVSNLDQSVEFYRDVVGLKLLVPQTPVLSGPKVDEMTGIPGVAMKLAMFEISKNNRLALIEYLKPASSLQYALPTTNIGSIHVALQVSDIEAKVREMKAKGVYFITVMNIPTDGPFVGWKYIYFKDPDGITLELVEDHNPTTNPE
jgi:catechol 2,3-dioxygenase-like lactoylglutathione lyase family enzyme